MKRELFLFAAAAAVLALAAPARAINWATDVADYSAGATYPSPDPGNWSFIPPTGSVDQVYTSPAAAALAGLTADTGYGVLTPFNGPYDPSQYLGLGAGGSITLQFPTPVRTNGYTIGVHTGSGLIDSDYPNGTAAISAPTYTTPRRATIDVRAADTGWITLGTFDLNNPSNFYAAGVDTPGYQPSVTAGTPADVEKPFPGTLASFSGETWPQILTTLDGSAGGNWLDLSSTGLPSVSYIRFTVPNGSVLYLDGVVGLPVPEPSSLALLALGTLAAIRRRRKRATNAHK
jgi:hypothetical protein